jgi:hypothetical protein
MPETCPPSPPDAPDDDATPGWGRRAFLLAAAGTGLSATVVGFWLAGLGDPTRRRRIEPTPSGGPGITFDAPTWAALEAALDRLIPSEPTAPGARDVNAIGYLDRVLAEPDLDPEVHRDPIVAGVPRLDEGARARGAASFAGLPPEGRDLVLRGFEADAAGVRWLKKLLYFGLEALLGDPVHGCQPGEVGWRWLQHGPPEPRPRTPGWKPTGR